MTGSSTSQQPQYRLWGDVPLKRRVGMVLGAAFGAWCIAAGFALRVATRDSPWSHDWLRRPLDEVLALALGLSGVVLVVAVPVWFFVVAAIMRDALTGYSTGMIKWGWDPHGHPCVVSHIRRGHHQFACRCELLHSDEEALAAEWRYSGETVSREGIGWGGLAHLLNDAEHPTESA